MGGRGGEGRGWGKWILTKNPNFFFVGVGGGGDGGGRLGGLVSAASRRRSDKKKNPVSRYSLHKIIYKISSS